MKSERERIVRQLTEVEKMLNELRVQYEQYFSGVEKIAPEKARNDLERQLRLLSRRRIVQTDLSYRLSNLSTSFHSYKSMWERIQRQMDEGRYPRHTKKISPYPDKTEKNESALQTSAVENLYKDYLNLCRECNVSASIDGVNSMDMFLRDKESLIRKRYGDVQVQFDVVNEAGRPKVKARLKR